MNLSDNRQTRVLKNKEAVAELAVNTWIKLSTASVSEKGVFTVALSGGSTPIGFYQQLAACPHPLSWDKTHIFFADERFVPPDDRDSNYRMINEHLLSHIPIPKKNIHPVLTEGVTLEESVNNYEATIRTFFKIGDTDIPVFDLIMLGLGEDGHTASLFPGTTALQETTRLTIPVIAESLPSKRISLSLGVINNAHNICFLVTGSSKAAVIKEIIEENKRMLPAAQVRSDRGTVLFLMDEDAASCLSSRGVKTRSRGDSRVDDRCLLFFVRNPERGTVKSRLAGSVGKTVALELYKNFIVDMLATLEKRTFPVYCCFYPEYALAEVKRIIGAQYQYLPQKGDDLGARMAHCFRQAFSKGFKRVVLIGSDLPDLPGEIIDEAFGSLKGAESVIGPALDGGYYLIGFNKESFTPEIFNSIAWSTETVLQKTLDILKHHNRTVHRLPRWRDIDTLEDLRLFFERNRDTSMSPRTMTYLKQNDIISK